MANEQPNLIWIDCEMTGLSLEKDVLVEIAVLVTDSDLNVIGEGVDVVIKASAEQLAGMNDFVTQMHTTSGLITEIPHYRTVDVSSIKELTRRWFPKAYFAAPAKTGNHRALGDIQDSIAELAYYRQAVFISAQNEEPTTA